MEDKPNIFWHLLLAMFGMDFKESPEELLAKYAPMEDIEAGINNIPTMSESDKADLIERIKKKKQELNEGEQ